MPFIIACVTNAYPHGDPRDIVNMDYLGECVDTGRWGYNYKDASTHWTCSMMVTDPFFHNAKPNFNPACPHADPNDLITLHSNVIAFDTREEAEDYRKKAERLQNAPDRNKYYVLPQIGAPELTDSAAYTKALEMAGVSSLYDPVCCSFSDRYDSQQRHEKLMSFWTKN